jgi:hypothetical protein
MYGNAAILAMLGSGAMFADLAANDIQIHRKMENHYSRAMNCNICPPSSEICKEEIAGENKSYLALLNYHSLHFQSYENQLD